MPRQPARAPPVQGEMPFRRRDLESGERTLRSHRVPGEVQVTSVGHSSLKGEDVRQGA